MIMGGISAGALEVRCRRLVLCALERVHMHHMHALRVTPRTLRVQIAAAAKHRSDAFVSLLAYNAPWMRTLWRRVALRCALPLEVPADAVRGTDVPSLRGGVAAFAPAQAAALQLFCDLLSHLLVVLDDEAFHGGGDPLPLPAFRAVALSLNSLVFHSCMHGRAAARPAATQRALLAVAGKCLQQLHSRHVRRPFCADAAWLAPWAAWSESQTVSPPPPSRLPASQQPTCVLFGCALIALAHHSNHLSGSICA